MTADKHDRTYRTYMTYGQFADIGTHGRHTSPLPCNSSSIHAAAHLYIRLQCSQRHRPTGRTGQTCPTAGLVTPSHSPAAMPCPAVSPQNVTKYSALGEFFLTVKQEPFCLYSTSCMTLPSSMTVILTFLSAGTPSICRVTSSS